ncbi:BMP family ABC transporter substrate-binding protein [Spirochaetia bacterium]|nr:BMP family ABC transporter substrate-binding protein [Spirochaetia bacterium]
MKRKTVKWMSVAIALTVLAAGNVMAGGNKQSSSGSNSSLKIGLLLPGPVNDGGWNASAFEGITEIKKKYPNAQISYQESIPPSNFEEIFRSYASQGYTMVFGHGYEFGDAAVKVAKEFPNVKFCVTSSDITSPPNVSSLRNNYQEMGYLMGVVAATMTKSNVVGFVGGMEIPSITEPFYAFEAGVKATKPSVRVISVLTGSFEDVAKAKEAALTIIEQGVDIIFQDADQSGFGVFEACREKGVLALGSIGDQAEIAPDNIITSGVCALSKAMVGVFDRVVDGTWGPNPYAMGAKEDAVSVAPFRKFESQVPQALKDQLTKLLADMRSGAFDAVAVTEKHKASR